MVQTYNGNSKSLTKVTKIIKKEGLFEAMNSSVELISQIQNIFLYLEII